MSARVPSDADLIRESLIEPERFGLVYRRHLDSVFAFVVRRAGRAAAADLTAEVFEKALKIRARYDLAQPNALPWLYGIARNLVGDRTRWLRRQAVLQLPDEPSVGFESDAVERVMAESVRTRLGEVLGRVNRRDLEPLLLYAVDGLSYNEVATALGIPSGTVATRIARARNALSEAIPELAQKTGRYETQEPTSNV